MNHTVKVIIPIYKESLKDWERASLENTMRVLSAYPIVFLTPPRLKIHFLTATYPTAEVMEVSSDWLGTRRGIAGYNEMMMSKAFYDLFADTDYILICHLDAWIFRDELNEWCRAGYDIVAAPWPMRPRYEHFPLKQWLALKHRLCAPGHIVRSHMFGRIGNGGLCLRRVSAFRQACTTYAVEIDTFNRHDDDLHNEDIFWALVPREFNYPDVATALRFAYDLKPQVCHHLNRGQLPMGCHGFMHKSRIRFWEQFIPFIKHSTDYR